MSSLTDYYHNHSTSAPILELDNHDENQYDSSFNKQNEVCFFDNSLIDLSN